MGGYKYAIKLRNGEYHFCLYPNNNNHQYMLASYGYNSVEQAQIALNKYKTYVITNGEQAFEIFKENGVFLFRFLGTDNTIQNSKIYVSKKNAKNGLKRVVENISAPLKVI